MMPTATEVNTDKKREGRAEFFNGHAGTTTVPIRFDQWFVHQMCGDPYASNPTEQGMDDPTYIARLAEACAIAGIEVDAAGVPVQSNSNDFKILPWFLLYCAQACNNLDVDFETWLQGTYGLTPAEVQRTEAGRAWLLERLKDFGLSPGLGQV
jgi:hypothetical protein